MQLNQAAVSWRRLLQLKSPAKLWTCSRTCHVLGPIHFLFLCVLTCRCTWSLYNNQNSEHQHRFVSVDTSHQPVSQTAGTKCRRESRHNRVRVFKVDTPMIPVRWSSKLFHLHSSCMCFIFIYPCFLQMFMSVVYVSDSFWCEDLSEAASNLIKQIEIWSLK